MSDEKRIAEYLQKMEEEYIVMYESYCHFISYDDKLHEGLNLDIESSNHLKELHEKFKNKLVYKLTQKVLNLSW